MEADKKIVNWMMKGTVEYNFLQRTIDMNLLSEAFLPDFKPINKVIVEYYSKYKTPPTYEILMDSLSDDFDSVQLCMLIQELDVSPAEIGYQVDQVKNRYNAFLAKKLNEAAPETSDPIELDEFNISLKRIASKIDRLKRNSVFAEGYLKDSADDRVNNYMYREANPNEISGVFSGYPEIDDYTWGIKKSELMVIVGASSSGKSLLMMNIAVKAWLGSNNPANGHVTHQDGKNVLYFTLEMNKEQTEQRLDACVAGIKLTSLQRGLLDDQEKDRWKKSIEFQKAYDKNIYICDIPRGSNINDIEARYESIISEFEPDLICVDYLGIMGSRDSQGGQDWLDVGKVAEEMHEFCRAKNMPVITAAQKKAKEKNSKSSQVDVESISRSKLVGDNANIVLVIENRDEEQLREDMVIHVVKNRDGRKGKLTLIKNFEKAQILSVPDNWVSDPGEENKY